MSAKTLVTVVLTGGLAFGIGLPAHAAEAPQPTCTTERVLVSEAVAGAPAVYGDAPLLSPAHAAWIERVLVSPAVAEVSHVVHHDAQYAERVVVDRPYVAATPAVAEVSHTVHHDAVTKTVHHEAVTKTVHQDAVTKTVHHDAVTRTDRTRYSWVGGGKGPSDGGDTPLTQPSHWNADNKKYDGSPTRVVLHQGNGNGSYFYWAETEVVVTAAWDEDVVVTPARDEQVVVAPAWDEDVVVTPAWDEKVVDVAAQPGMPEQPEVSHVEHDLVREAWDETVVDVAAQDAVYADVEHPAEDAVYGERPLVSAAVDPQAAVYTTEEICTIISAEGPSSGGEETSAQPTAVLAEGPEGARHGAAPAALAQTGGGVAPVVPLGAGALVAGGIAALLLRRRARGGAED